jgi:tRNA 2-selenouridine synthase
MDTISCEEALRNACTFIDTRAPVEFAVDHIPGAVNIPILDNEERALVGTMYAKVDKELAIKKGYEIYGKKIGFLENELSKIKGKIVIYCFRGQMRSETITKLALDSGLDAVQLKGGYKAYRQYVREHLHKFRLRPKLIVVYGLTGTGKTELLQQFSDMIDIEGLAQHRSSVYGAVGLKPNTQKMFESLLYQELLSLNSRKYILIEGESRKIGNVMLPEFLFSAMREGIKIKLEASKAERVKRLVSIYAGKPNLIPVLREKTMSLEKRLGKNIVAELLECLDKGDHERFMEILIDKYYDPLYGHTIDGFDYMLTVKFSDGVQALRHKFGLK